MAFGHAGQTETEARAARHARQLNGHRDALNSALYGSEDLPSLEAHVGATSKTPAVAAKIGDTVRPILFYGADLASETAQNNDRITARLEAESAARREIARPHHYARYAIEPITFIMANNLPFCVGNVVKYVLRYDAKNGREDLMKARRYIDMILEDMDRKENGSQRDVVGRPL